MILYLRQTDQPLSLIHISMVPHHRLWRTNLCASRINLPPFSVMITIRSLSASALLVASLLATALPAVAAEQKAARKPDAAKGQALAGVCAGCHGADGQSPVPVSYTHLDVYKRQAVGTNRRAAFGTRWRGVCARSRPCDRSNRASACAPTESECRLVVT